ncbi:MAG: DUF2262 domain-containing protein [Pleurocapsa sp. SU_196_0]|nr:DUF2262 domain-containing protein [Pleurocapsa sp. SU_196_0]
MRESHQDPVLGTLVFNRDLDCYEGSVQSGADKIDISISLEGVTDGERLIVAVSANVSSALQLLPKAKGYVTDQLLDIKNGHWLEDDEKPLSRRRFMSDLTPKALVARTPIDWELYFDAAELFWGHDIVVFWNATKGFERAETVG